MVNSFIADNLSSEMGTQTMNYEPSTKKITQFHYTFYNITFLNQYYVGSIRTGLVSRFRRRI